MAEMGNREYEGRFAAARVLQQMTYLRKAVEELRDTEWPWTEERREKVRLKWANLQSAIDELKKRMERRAWNSKK